MGCSTFVFFHIPIIPSYRTRATTCVPDERDSHIMSFDFIINIINNRCSMRNTYFFRTRRTATILLPAGVIASVAPKQYLIIYYQSSLYSLIIDYLIIFVIIIVMFKTRFLMFQLFRFRNSNIPNHFVYFKRQKAVIVSNNIIYIIYLYIILIFNNYDVIYDYMKLFFVDKFILDLYHRV